MTFNAKTGCRSNSVQTAIEITPFKTGNSPALRTNEVVKMTRLTGYISLFAYRPMNTSQPATGVKLLNSTIYSCAPRRFTVCTEIGVELFGTKRCLIRNYRFNHTQAWRGNP
jgi:hypothetical protein